MEGPKDIAERIYGLKANQKSGYVDAMGCPFSGAFQKAHGGTPGEMDQAAGGLIDRVETALNSAGQAAASLVGLSGDSPTPILTSVYGFPISGDATHSLKIQGHPVVSDVLLMEKQQMFNRSKIVERPVHACGSGAMGYFELTQDMSRFTKAKFLGPAGLTQKTPLLGRFSTVTYGREFPDSARNPRGLAFKFYTEEGNYDILCINFPIFFCRDPMLGPDVIRTQSRNPENFMINYDAMFDFMSLTPESMLANCWFWSDHGTPVGWRFMDGFPCHTFRWVNAAGEAFYVKYRFKSEQGIKNFTFQEAVLMCGKDPDYAKRDLWAHINNGGIAAWQWQVQIMPAADATTYKWDPFDNTKVWEETDYPWTPFGRLVFDKNPENFHRDIEQAAFSPGRLVPGIEPSPDPLLQFRCWFYMDSQINRLGKNYHQIPVNCPFRTKNYHPLDRDGPMRTDTNGGAETHYVPNSVPLPLSAKRFDPQYQWAPEHISGVLTRGPSSKHELKLGDDYIQARQFFSSLDAASRQHLFTNIAECLKLVSSTDIQTRWLVACYLTHPEFAAGLISLLSNPKISYTTVELCGKQVGAVSDPLQGYSVLIHNQTP